MSSTSSPAIRFTCECGAILKARVQLAGKKGVCGRCSATMIIPLAADTITADLVDDDKAIAIRAICGVCQCAIEDDELDQRLTCDRCELPFHDECWEENLGCSAYGCKNVNVLKMGADITISAEAEDATAPRRGPPPAPATQATSTAEEIPWEFVCMGGAAIAAPFSLLLFGVPSLIAGAAAAMVFINQGGKANTAALVVALLLAAMGLITGSVNSLLYWTW